MITLNLLQMFLILAIVLVLCYLVKSWGEAFLEGFVNTCAEVVKGSTLRHRKALFFVQHVKGHLRPEQQVICKLCDHTFDEITKGVE